MAVGLLVFLHCVLVKFVRGFSRVFRRKGEYIPPIDPQNGVFRCSAVELAAKIRRRELTSLSVLKEFIGRIEKINPLLNCVVDERYNDALSDAKLADQLIASNQYSEHDLEKQFPLLGVPFSTKDHNPVKGMILTCGLVARKGVRSDVDSDTVALMRKAGAIPLVLTNVPELCLSFECYNVLHGRTNNPYDTNRIPGGSSGGEGSLLTASGCPVGVGSDIGGSIRIPSLFCGIFGHKPSAKIVSMNGTLPSAPAPLDLLATIGPMSRFAEDLPIVLKVLAGDNAARLRLDDSVETKELKVFYQMHDGGAPFVAKVEDDISSCIMKAVSHFQRVCTEPPMRKHIEGLRNGFPLWLNGMSSVDTESMLPSPVLELLKWTFGLSEHSLQMIAVVFQGKTSKPSDSEKVYWDNETAKLKAEFDAMLGTNGVFLYPTHPSVALYHSEAIVRVPNIHYTGVFNVLGLPSTAVPMGIGREGLPVGLQVVANWGQDRLCLAVARELEKAFGGWQEPGIVQNV